MKTVDMLETDCLAAFERWLLEERTKQLTTDPEALVHRAFVAGFKAGGHVGAKLMHEETLRTFKDGRLT